jgi:RNA polymerase sigma-70 factor (ECF subfamily)
LSGAYEDIHRDLIDKCRKGDNRAQYRLYKLYVKAMYNICIRMLPNRIDAEDVLQDAFVKAFKNLSRFKGESTFGAWLKRIVINQCIDQVKKSKRMFIEFDGIEIADESEDELDMMDLPKPEIVHQAIKDLPEGARVVFNLFMLEGYKHKEISEMLNISESTSKSQYQRARTLLQDKLKEQYHEVQN